MVSRSSEGFCVVRTTSRHTEDYLLEGHLHTFYFSSNSLELSVNVPESVVSPIYTRRCPSSVYAVLLSSWYILRDFLDILRGRSLPPPISSWLVTRNSHLVMCPSNTLLPRYITSVPSLYTSTNIAFLVTSTPSRPFPDTPAATPSLSWAPHLNLLFVREQSPQLR